MLSMTKESLVSPISNASKIVLYKKQEKGECENDQQRRKELHWLSNRSYRHEEMLILVLSKRDGDI